MAAAPTGYAGGEPGIDDMTVPGAVRVEPMVARPSWFAMDDDANPAADMLGPTMRAWIATPDVIMYCAASRGGPTYLLLPSCPGTRRQGRTLSFSSRWAPPPRPGCRRRLRARMVLPTASPGATGAMD